MQKHFLTTALALFCLVVANAQQRKYVNDNSSTGDIFTTSLGNNSHTGSATDPFLTLQYALQQAAIGDTVYVDAGTYAEQVIINKGITIIGAGSARTSFVTPIAPLVPAPGPFTEIGLFETTQGIGDVHIRDISVTSDFTSPSQNIIIQSGGSVKNCKLINGNQAVYFRVESAIKSAVAEGNIISAEYIGINCQGTGLSVFLTNNQITTNNQGFSAGAFAGDDFGPLQQYTAIGNSFSNYVFRGIQVNSLNPIIHQNSFLGNKGFAIQRNGGSVPNATCNWFGTNNGDSIAAKLAGNVDFIPWLISGDDINAAVGFQPGENRCAGEYPKVAAGALDFDGVNDYAEGANAALPQGNAARTIEAWINPTTTQNGTIFNWGNTNNNQRSGLLYIGGKLYYVGHSNDLQGNISIPAGSWTHVAASFDGVTLKLYVNGVLDVSSPKNFATNGTGFRFGTAAGSPGGLYEFFKGKIDETRIWNKALTQCDIQNNMSCELSGNEPGLVGYYQMNQGYNNYSNSEESSIIEAGSHAKNAGLMNVNLAGLNSNWTSNQALQSDFQCRRQNVFIYNDSTTQRACSGSQQSFTARPMKPGGSLTYQWYKNSLLLTGEAGTVFLSNALQNNDTIRCIMTENGACGKIVYNSNSEVVKMTLTNYLFNGNGSWDVSANWLNNNIPPAVLPACSKIEINPIPGGVCILNNQQYVAAGGSIIVQPGSQLKIVNELMLLDSTFLNANDTFEYATGLRLPASPELQQMSFFDESDTALVKQSSIIQNGIGERVELDMPAARNQSMFEKKIGSCAAWAIGYGLMGYYLHKAENNADYANQDKLTSPTFIWNQFYLKDVVEGITLWQALNLVKQQGICKWYDWKGYEPSGNGPSVESRIYARQYLSDGLEFKLMSFVDIGRIKFQIKNGNPVPIGIKIYESFVQNFNGFQKPGYRKTSDGRYVFNNPFQMSVEGKIKASENIFEKHALLICGYDDDINAFKIMNSWNPGIWGEAGFTWIDYETLKLIIDRMGNDVPSEYRGKPYIMAVWRKRTTDITVELKLDKKCGSIFTNSITINAKSSENAPVYEKGFCFSTIRNPTTATDYPSNKTFKRGPGLGIEVVSTDLATLAGLLTDVKYYVRGYAKSRDGIIYSKEDSIIITKQASALPKSVEVISGANQKGYSLRKLKEPFAVLVKDNNGKPVFNAIVEWRQGFGGNSGTLDSAYSYTDENGVARNWLTLGLGGAYQIYPRVLTDPINCLYNEVYVEANFVEPVVMVAPAYLTNDGQAVGVPYAMCMDSAKNIFVSTTTGKVSRWAPNSTTGVLITNGKLPGGYTDYEALDIQALAPRDPNTVIASTGASIRSWTLGVNRSDSVIGGGYVSRIWLTQPKGFFVTGSGTIYIAESGSHCISKWAPGSQTGEVVAGYPDNRSTKQGFYPIAGASEVLLNKPYDVFVDGAGNMYVADANNHRVQKWAPGASSGITVAGGNGAGLREDQLNFPVSVWVEGNGDLFIADRLNHRIQKWPAGASKGITVAGVGYYGDQPSRLFAPHKVIVKGNFIYVSDSKGVTRWPNE